VVAGYTGELAMCTVSNEEGDDDSGFGPVLERPEREGGCIEDVEAVGKEPSESCGLSKRVKSQYTV